MDALINTNAPKENLFFCESLFALLDDELYFHFRRRPKIQTLKLFGFRQIKRRHFSQERLDHFRVLQGAVRPLVDVFYRLVTNRAHVLKRTFEALLHVFVARFRLDFANHVVNLGDNR